MPLSPPPQVRPATATDILSIVDMVETLRAAVAGPIVVDRAWTAQTLAALIASPDGAVWVSGGGFLAASIQRSVVSPVPMAVEHGWWSTDGSGLRLLRAYERWAQDKGAAVVTLSTGATGPDLARLGYRRAEQAWVRGI